MCGSQAETRDRKPATGTATRKNIPIFVLTGIDNWTRPGFFSLAGPTVIPPDLCRLGEFYALLVCIEWI